MKFRFFIMGLAILFLCIFIFLSIFLAKKEQIKHALEKKNFQLQLYSKNK